MLVLDVRSSSKESSFGWQVTSIEPWKSELINFAKIEQVSLHHIPKFVWVKMLVQPFISQTHKGFVFTQCHTFNKILSSTVNKFNNMVVIQFDLPDDGDLFDLQGNLAVVGKSQFCRELNCQIRQLDHSSPTAHSNSSAASYDRRATDSDFFPSGVDHHNYSASSRRRQQFNDADHTEPIICDKNMRRMSLDHAYHNRNIHKF